jgi:hypothetical protein
MEVDIFQKIARKGQIKENSKRRTPLIFFLEECLNQQNKEIISELRKIEKKELKGVIGDIEKLQVQFDNSQIKTDIQKAVSDQREQRGDARKQNYFKRASRSQCQL